MVESAIVVQLRHIYAALALKSKLRFTRGLVTQICITQQNKGSMKKYRTRPRNPQRNKHTISPVSRPEWGGKGGWGGVLVFRMVGLCGTNLETCTLTKFCDFPCPVQT